MSSTGFGKKPSRMNEAMIGTTTTFSRIDRSCGDSPSAKVGLGPVMVRWYISRMYSAARTVPSVAMTAAAS